MSAAAGLLHKSTHPALSCLAADLAHSSTVKLGQHEARTLPERPHRFRDQTRGISSRARRGIVESGNSETMNFGPERFDATSSVLDTAWSVVSLTPSAQGAANP
jgi:hypothetical protein